MEREHLGSRLGFILLSAGCAIGVGNVWKFPWMAGQYGGGAFVLVYLFFLFMLGQYLITGSVGEWPAAPILGIFCFACSALQLVRLKQELEARGMPFSWKL